MTSALPHLVSPRVSIVIPTYRRADLLTGVVRSVLDQPVKEIEIHVVDDGSNDDTEARMGEIADSRLHYWNFGKLGMPGVLNAGLTKCAAEYVLFLHDHDRIEPGLVVEMLGALDGNPSAGYCFCGYAFYDSDLVQEKERWLLDLPECVPGRVFLERYLMPRINSPVLALSMVRRSALLAEQFLPEFGGCSDVELWHRLASRTDVAYVRKPLIRIRGRDPSSQFSSAGPTLRLMINSVLAKERYLGLFPPARQRRWTRSWKRQVDFGSLYAAWKAFEAGDRETLLETRRFVQTHGSPAGRAALAILANTPAAIGLTLLRGVRGAARKWRRSTC